MSIGPSGAAAWPGSIGWGTAGALAVFADAAAGDAELAGVWADYERRRWQDLRGLVGALEPWLRDELTAERATDLYWALFSHAPWRDLLTVRSWSVDDCADLLVDGVRRLLLADRPDAAPGVAPSG